jgi:hypothetical protein
MCASVIIQHQKEFLIHMGTSVELDLRNWHLQRKEKDVEN